MALRRSRVAVHFGVCTHGEPHRVSVGCVVRWLCEMRANLFVAGKKAFSNYLGDDQAAWQQYDAVHLLQQYAAVARRCLISRRSYDGDRVDVLVDQGSADNFLAEQLGTPALRQAAALPNNASVVVRMQSGYDHGFFFISTFIESHIEFHARRLGINVDGEPDADEDQTATSAEDHN